MLFAKLDAHDNANDPVFGGGDHLLIWAWRRIAFGQIKCPLLPREFNESFGDDGAEVLAMLQVFLHALDAACWSPLRIGLPGGYCVTRDEELALTLLAAAQSGNHSLFERSIMHLARPEWRHVVAIAANGLAKAFTLNGLCLGIAPHDMVCPQQSNAGL